MTRTALARTSYRSGWRCARQRARLILHCPCSPMLGTALAVLVGARLAWWAWSSPTPEQYTYHEDASWRSYAQRQEAQRTAEAQRLRAQEAARLEQERLRRAAAAASAARFTARDYAQAPSRPATYAGETRAAAPRAPWPRERSPFRAPPPGHTYSEIDTDTDSDVSDTPTDAVSVVSHPHGRERRAQRGVSLSELRAAVKHGRKTPARNGRRGQKRWRFEYGGVVYITDETCRHEVPGSYHPAARREGHHAHRHLDAPGGQQLLQPDAPDEEAGRQLAV